ncbi:MAG TPA: helix-turn-helix domain-containing protein [Blastocatellia bacterium]|nr:helix-turn-helix domain-containing protein [Blastocatellia bacterium]
MRESLERLVDEMVERGIRFEDAVREFEMMFIVKVMERHRGNISRTARELGIHRNTLRSRLKAYRARFRTSPGMSTADDRLS